MDGTVKGESEGEREGKWEGSGKKKKASAINNALPRARGKW